MISSLALLGALVFIADPATQGPSIPWESFKLPNGLHVILSEDHTAPVVGIDVTYHVGSRDEKPDRTGIAHLFEHLRFEGSEHVSAAGSERLIEGAGGTSNGSTGVDRTQYWKQVPSNALEQMLYLESDKMGFLLSTLDQTKLDNQREVVLNERRQSFEMEPYGLGWMRLVEKLWDLPFPYHWHPIGSPQDIEAVTLDEVREFFEGYYGPNNASLAIAGDIDLQETRALVEKWFGSIPAGLVPKRSYPPPQPLPGERRIQMEDQVQLPRLYLAWQTPKAYTPGDAALTILGEILSSGKSARLVHRMVMKEQIAQSVSASQQGEALAGMFLIVVEPKPGVLLERLEREIDEEIARLFQEPPSLAEFERARNQVESQMLFALEPVGGFGGRAAMLNDYYWGTGDPGYFPKDLERYRLVTAVDVRTAAAQWLGKKRVVLTIVPRTVPTEMGGQKAAAGGAN